MKSMTQYFTEIANHQYHIDCLFVRKTNSLITK